MKNALLSLDEIDSFLGFAGAGLGNGAPPAEFGPSEDPFYSVIGGAIYGTYIPAGYDNTTPASGADPGQSVAVSSGGLTINVIYTSAALSAPQSFRDGIQQAVAIMAAAISDPITVNIRVNWSGTGGGASAGPSSGLYETYNWVRTNLINNASPGDTSFNSLPAGSSIQNQTNVAVWNAQLKLWGILAPNDTSTNDGSANFATDINPNLLVGVALHELTHAMGRIPYGPAPDIFDLFRFTSPGTRLFQGGATAPAAYFSLDGGTTKIADYGRTSDASDFLNSGVQGPNDPFNEFYNSGTVQQLTAVDLKQLAALGFHLTANTPITIEAFGSTKLLQAAGNFILAPVASNTGPTLKLNNAPVTAGMYGAAFVPIGAEITASGYEFAWRNTSTDLYTIWFTDSSGNYLSTPAANLTGGNATLEAYETSFHQDLNNDGVIGNALSTVEGAGSTSLIKSGNNFYLGTSGPLLKVGGAAVTPSSYPGWLPVGVEAIAGGGFEVAWRDSTGTQFSIWYTDSAGNFVSNQTGIVAGNSSTLISFENSFHQDLNNDGMIGFPSVLLESAGSTSLVQSGANFYFGSTAGPLLKIYGAAVTPSTYPGWLPFGVEAIAGGFEVAWHDASNTQFSIWYTDSAGNFTSNQTGIVPGSSSTLMSFENSFHQDLNNDGVIGLPSTVTIESAGTTSLVQSGANFYFGSTAGPLLKIYGAAVTPSTYPGWLPFAVEPTATGYEVALRDSSHTQFSIWYTDSAGNFVSNQTGIVAGNSATLMSFESSFHQDLNGDGITGFQSSVTIESAGVTNLAQAGGNFYFGGPSGPMLKLGGAPVTAATYPGWLPIAVEPIASGFQVAWRDSTGTQFSIWNTDSSGNFVSNQTGIVAGNSATLQSFEASFQQDLNNDGFVGAHTAPMPAGAGQDAFVFKADADPVWRGDSNGHTALETLLTATPLQAMVHEAPQPLHDLFAAVSADLNTQDAHAPPVALAHLLSGHFIIH